MSSFSIWHWLVVAALVLPFLIPALIRGSSKKKPQAPAKPPLTKPSPARPVVATASEVADEDADEDDFQLEVVGESHYQSALLSLCGGRTPDGVEKLFNAELVPDNANPHDKNAVRVEIGGRTVGYLSRDDARAWRVRREPTRCRALVRGGWDRGSGDKGHFGVLLDADL